VTASARGSLWPALAVAALAAALAWFAGGQAMLGRIDPALALPLLVPPLALLSWWLRGEAGPARRRAFLIALLSLAAIQCLLTLLLAHALDGGGVALVAVAGVATAWLCDAIVRWRRRAALRIAALLLLAVGWFAAGHAALAALYRPAFRAAAPATMLTGLPLRWAGGGGIAAMIADGSQDDPALRAIEAALPVRLVDSLVDHPPPPGGALLLAHPRALAPRELVAIDAFVRGGGRAVVLADALSGWPPAHPLGDPRNPPVTSLLTPLLDRWGVTLDAAPPGDRAARPVDVDGARLRLFSAGRFARLPPGCRSFADARVAACPIGRGQAWLVGDADLLFAPLWQPVPPWAAHLRKADTIEWIAARLAGRDGAQGWLRPLWIRPAAG